MHNLSKINKTLRILFQETTFINLMAFFKTFTLKKFFNFILVNFQYLLGSSKIQGYPYSLTIDTNNICNLSCIYCPTGQNQIKRKKGIMNFENFKKIINELSDYVFILNLYAWGEPFLTPKIFKMIRYAKKKNLFVLISTNFNIPSKKINKIVSSRLDYLIVGLDGVDQNSYEKYRKGGDFNKVIGNIKKLNRIKKYKHLKIPSLHLQFLIFKHNQNDASKMKTLAGKLKADFFEILKGTWTKNHLYLTDLETISEKDIKKKCKCIYPWNKMLVYWDGGVVPCPFKYDEKDDLGNIILNGFSSVWNGEKYCLVRKKQQNPSKIKKTTICDTCPIYLKKYKYDNV